MAELRAAIDEHGYARTPARSPVLSAGECRVLSDLYDRGRFRSTVTMARHRFGEGEYRYSALEPRAAPTSCTSSAVPS